tara:strand:+ start:3691 stop:5487 length:1797 start_codon:yes stop_codon:yes gene_type:complete
MAIEQLGESLLAQARKKSKKEKKKAYAFTGLLLGLKAKNYYLRKKAASRMQEFNNSLMPVIQNVAGNLNEANQYFSERDKLLTKYNTQDYKTALRLQEDAKLKASQEYKAPTDTIEYSKYLDSLVEKKYEADQEKNKLYLQYLPQYKAGNLGIDLKSFNLSDVKDVKKLPPQLQKIIVDTQKTLARTSKTGGAMMAYMQGKTGQLVEAELGGRTVLIPRGVEESEAMTRLAAYLESVQRTNTGVELIKDESGVTPLYKQPPEIQAIFKDKQPDFTRNKAIDSYIVSMIDINPNSTTQKDILKSQYGKNWKDRLPSLDIPDDDKGGIPLYDIANMLSYAPTKQTNGTTGPSNKENFMSALAYEATRIEASKSAIDKNIQVSTQEALSSFGERGLFVMRDTDQYDRHNKPIQEFHFKYDEFKNAVDKADNDIPNKDLFPSDASDEEILQGINQAIADKKATVKDKLDFIIRAQETYGGSKNKELDLKLNELRKSLEEKKKDPIMSGLYNARGEPIKEMPSIPSLLGMDKESQKERSVKRAENALSYIEEDGNINRALGISGITRSKMFREFLKERDIKTTKLAKLPNITDLLEEFITLQS